MSSMRKMRRRKTRKRNRNLQKNRRNQRQRTRKRENAGEKSDPQRTHNLPIRNESEPSAHCFWAESSDKGISAQYLRPNFQPIYHLAQSSNKRRYQWLFIFI